MSGNPNQRGGNFNYKFGGSFKGNVGGIDVEISLMPDGTYKGNVQGPSASGNVSGSTGGNSGSTGGASGSTPPRKIFGLSLGTAAALGGLAYAVMKKG